jgi:hypothetical protein
MDNFETIVMRFSSACFSVGIEGPAMDALLAAHEQDKNTVARSIYLDMLQAAEDNEKAGHKWSSADWRKYAEYELEELN